MFDRQSIWTRRSHGRTLGRSYVFFWTQYRRKKFNVALFSNTGGWHAFDHTTIGRHYDQRRSTIGTILRYRRSTSDRQLVSQWQSRIVVDHLLFVSLFQLISSLDETKADYHGEHTIFNLGHLRILQGEDAGTVDCLVKNRFGEARTSCRLHVNHDPGCDRWIECSTQGSVFSFTNAFLLCRYFPTSLICWRT